MSVLRPVDMVREAVKALAALQPVPAQLRRALGQASPASFLETPIRPLIRAASRTTL